MTNDKSHVAETPADDPRRKSGGNNPKDAPATMPKGEKPTTDDFEREWNDLDEKVILVQILTELQQIRLLLSEATDGAQSDADAEEMYRCTKCESTVTADERERHARSQHKAPGDMVTALFEEVDG